MWVDGQSTDKFDLSAIDANTSTSGDQAFKLVSAFDKHAGEITLAYNKTNARMVLSADVNGDGKADMVVWMTGDHHDFTGFVL